MGKTIFCVLFLVGIVGTVNANLPEQYSPIREDFVIT